MSHLILASSSPQRKQLLEEIGVDFRMCPSTVDESSCTECEPRSRAVTLACLKARDVQKYFPNNFILGCDTLVVTQDGKLLEKPHDRDDARRMLMIQSGKVTTIHSGLCIISPRGEEHVAVDSPRVHFATFHNDDVAWWLKTQKWEGGSGAFRVEEFEKRGLIDHIEGDRSAVIGLPLVLLREMFKDFGFVVQAS